ncbi:MAG: hypothetical protein WBV71_02250 [Roseobacter sp.]
MPEATASTTSYTLKPPALPPVLFSIVLLPLSLGAGIIAIGHLLVGVPENETWERGATMAVFTALCAAASWGRCIDARVPFSPPLQRMVYAVRT